MSANGGRIRARRRRCKAPDSARRAAKPIATRVRRQTATVAAPSPADARSIGLRYSRDDQPGIRRRRQGDDWRYETDDGTPVRDEGTLDRIRALAVPPAWTDVWICATERGHLQATGRDARGRKQYRYHREFRASRESAKFEQLIEFGRALPRIRAAVAADLERPGLPREKVLAACVRVLELTLMRVGNDEYVEQNRSYGLTTLRDRHARIAGSQVRFRFRGKGGKVHEVGFRDRRLGAIVRRCQELPGQELFQYVDDEGVTRDVASEDVNDYLRAIAGTDVSAKMFRTWAATVLANRALTAYQATESSRVQKRNVAAAMQDVADLLGNTPTVARQSYVHPAVLDAYLEGSLGEALVTAAEDERPEPAPQPNPAEEEAVIDLIRRRLADDRTKRRSKRQTKGRPRRRTDRPA
jgi:DNA topoisomerase I